MFRLGLFVRHRWEIGDNCYSTYSPCSSFRSSVHSIRPSFRQFDSPSVRSSDSPRARPSVRQSFRTSVRPSVPLSVRPSVRPSSVRPSSRPAVHRPHIRPRLQITDGSSVKNELQMIVVQKVHMSFVPQVCNAQCIMSGTRNHLTVHSISFVGIYS